MCDTILLYMINYRFEKGSDILKDFIEFKGKLLKENPDYIFGALEFSSDGIFICDELGNTIYVNPAYEKTTGLKRDAILGKNLNNMLKENIFNISASLKVLESKQPLSLIHRYVSGRTALTTAAPIYDDEQNIIGVICNTRNIEELMDLRKELEKINIIKQRYSEELELLRKQHFSVKGLVYKSKAMKETLDVASTAAEFDSTILLTGESGTGKEVLAKFIYQNSSRKDKAFIKVNCAAIPKNLFESELFGYMPGSFTGASSKGKAGMFELANGGTILLDEIGELTMPIQSKLLRVIQEQEVSAFLRFSIFSLILSSEPLIVEELDESFLMILSNFVEISSNISNLVLIESNFSLFAETVSYNLSISC